MKRPYSSKPAMTRAGKRNAAFMALVLGAKPDRESLKRSFKVTDGELDAMQADIEGRR